MEVSYLTKIFSFDHILWKIIQQKNNYVGDHIMNQ